MFYRTNMYLESTMEAQNAVSLLLGISNGFGIENCRAVATPMEILSLADLNKIDQLLPTDVQYGQAIGSLIFLVSCTRPYIAFSVSGLSKYLEKPQENHWGSVKRAPIYVCAQRSSNFELIRGYIPNIAWHMTYREGDPY